MPRWCHNSVKHYELLTFSHPFLGHQEGAIFIQDVSTLTVALSLQKTVGGKLHISCYLGMNIHNRVFFSL